MRSPLRLDSEPTSGAILGKFFTGKRLKNHIKLMVFDQIAMFENGSESW
jgi:hypothetical protein